MPHAVEQRQNHRVGANRRCERINRIVEVIGFTAQQDKVEMLMKRVRLNRRRVRYLDVTKGAFDDQPGLSQLPSAARPDQKHDISLCL